MRKEAKICWTWPKNLLGQRRPNVTSVVCGKQTQSGTPSIWLMLRKHGFLSERRHSQHRLQAAWATNHTVVNHVINVWITCHTFAPASFSKKTQAEAENNWHGRGTEPQFQCPAQDWQANRPEANTAQKPRHSIFAPKSADCLECNASSWHHHELTVFHMFYHNSNLVPSQKKKSSGSPTR